jgi:ribosomal protein L7/L12
MHFRPAAAVAGQLLRRGGQPKPTSPRTDISNAEIDVELRMAHKVEVIQLCRQKCGYGLKTAVDEINTRSAKLGLRP